MARRPRLLRPAVSRHSRAFAKPGGFLNAQPQAGSHEVRGDLGDGLAWLSAASAPKLQPAPMRLFAVAKLTGSFAGSPPRLLLRLDRPERALRLLTSSLAGLKSRSRPTRGFDLRSAQAGCASASCRHSRWGGGRQFLLLLAGGRVELGLPPTPLVPPKKRPRKIAAPLSPLARLREQWACEDVISFKTLPQLPGLELGR